MKKQIKHLIPVCLLLGGLVLCLASLTGCGAKSEGGKASKNDSICTMIDQMLKERQDYISTHPDMSSIFAPGSDEAKMYKVATDSAVLVWNEFYRYCQKGKYCKAAAMCMDDETSIWLRLFWMSSDLNYVFHSSVLEQVLLKCDGIDSLNAMRRVAGEVGMDVQYMSFLVSPTYEPDLFLGAVHELVFRYMDLGESDAALELGDLVYEAYERCGDKVRGIVNRAAVVSLAKACMDDFDGAAAVLDEVLPSVKPLCGEEEYRKVEQAVELLKADLKAYYDEQRAAETK